MSKLRRQITLIVFVLTLAMLGVVTIGFGIISYSTCTHDADKMIDMICDNNAKMPQFGQYKPDEKPEQEFYGVFNFNAESQYRTRYFVVYIDEQTDTMRTKMDAIASIDAKQAENIAQKALDQDSEAGYVGKYRFRNVKEDKYIVFLDCTEELGRTRNATIIIGVIGLFLTTLISVIFAFASKRVIKPFIDNVNKQKQFITDAGHELKTPLAVIRANNDLIKFKAKNVQEHTDDIKSEVDNLNDLIEKLLFLAKSNEVDTKLSKEEIDISELINNKIHEYTTVFEEKSVKTTSEINDKVKISANLEGIDRLVSILFDNCSKYVPENGEVTVKLQKSARHIEFSIANTDQNKKPIDTDRLFDRFYRTDDSRNSSTGGHGIGLSIAKRICEQHNGKISCTQHNGMFVFDVSLPIN